MNTFVLLKAASSSRTVSAIKSYLCRFAVIQVNAIVHGTLAQKQHETRLTSSDTAVASGLYFAEAK